MEKEEQQLLTPLSESSSKEVLGGFAPPTPEQLEQFNPLERLIICW